MTVIINGTTGISGVDGSAGTPAVQGSDTNTGVFYPAADTVGVSTGGSERMRVDSSGNVGIGTASPSSYGLLSVVSSTAGSAKISIQDTSGGASPAPLVQFGVNSSNGFNTSDAARVWTTSPSSSTAALNFAAYNGGAPSTAQMTLTGGNVGIGGTPGSYKLNLIGTAATLFPAIGVTGTTTSAAYGSFVNSGNTVLFGVESSAGGSLFVGSSAYASVFGNSSGSQSLQFATNNTVRATIDSSGNLQFNSGYGSVATAYGCRAWVNFNGTGTVAIRASGNVTSITDNGTGDYTVNFTNAMPDTNYSNVLGCNSDLSNGAFVVVMGIASNSGVVNTKTTTALRVTTKNQSWNFTDGTELNVAVFR